MYDVAVIGAGFAGMTAARDLSADGYSVIHLEGRDRIGGRTYAGEAFGRSVEFGGAYAHWTQPNVWRELERYGIALAAPMAIDKLYWLADGAVHSGSPVEYAAVGEPLIDRFVADSRAQFPRPFDLSAADTTVIEKQTLADRLESLDLSPYEQDVVDGMMSSLVHSYTEQGLAQFLFWTALNVGHWRSFIETAGQWPIQGGTRRLLDAIAGDSTAELRLTSPVDAVEDDGSGVVVTIRGGERVRARQAVLAVPLNTLHDLRITPELTGPVRRMVEEKHPMRTRKLWVRVRGEIETFVANAPVGKHPVNTAKTEYRHEGDTLVVCFCSDASSIDPDDHDAVQRALRLFVPEIEVVDVAAHDWVTDEFSQGTWVHHRPGNLTTVVPLMHQAHGRIRFAGGDIAPMGVGGIDGAIQSGAKAARDSARALADDRS
ncbi:FAD-dependent oxidoreductase [Pseudonocardia sp. C8]|uniref:flavin monoamine oxidase family protein n=1 Tax=Pseudonocardia sp. C8 TaxID=2762759 RepID=UPI001642BD91|nr:NAD(P)/FAD-dependent oxidoreductase [Pseudonocardia sp. C8]MBC3192176.1 FAD-dependent oxidoreductase [Pseudonocardia sp. C8]